MAKIASMEMEYVLVLWPEAQLLKNYFWFDRECYLMQGMGDQEHFDSSYFVPKARYAEAHRENHELPSE